MRITAEREQPTTQHPPLPPEPHPTAAVPLPTASVAEPEQGQLHHRYVATGLHGADAGTLLVRRHPPAPKMPPPPAEGDASPVLSAARPARPGFAPPLLHPSAAVQEQRAHSKAKPQEAKSQGRRAALPVGELVVAGRAVDFELAEFGHHGADINGTVVAVERTYSTRLIFSLRLVVAPRSVRPPVVSPFQMLSQRLRLSSR